MMTGTFDLGRVTGFSAYEVWKAQPGNENKTEQDFLKFISSGGDWIDFDTTPVDFDSVRTYRTYGSTANLDTDLTRGSVPNDALSIEFSGGTFIFESKSVRSNIRKSTDYDTIQTIILFADASNQVGKYVRYGVYDEDEQSIFFKRIDWVMVDFFSDAGDHIVDIAGRLCNQFSIKIGDVTKKTDGTNDVEFTKEELELGNDWIDFDTTPIDFDSVRTYRTYGSTANLDTDLTRGSVPGDALSAEFSPGTFMFESHSCRNNLKKSTEYDTIQTMILFSGSANPDEFAKYVRYGIFDEDDQTFTVQADWTMSGQFMDNEYTVRKAWKLAKTFNLKIAGVTKPVDGSQNVEFTKEELGLSEGGSSANEYYFEQIFEGYVPKTTLKIKDDIKDGLVFLVQLAPRVKTKMYSQTNGWAGGMGNFPYINDYRYFQPSASPNSDIGTNSFNLADYSLCFLLTSVPMNRESTQSNVYVSASQSNSYGYTATEKVEFLHTKQRVEQLLYDGNSAYPKGNSVVLTLLGWENLTDGGFYVTIESISDFGYANTKPFITRIWKLTKK